MLHDNIFAVSGVDGSPERSLWIGVEEGPR
jgi:hypothetical protein